MDIWPPPELNIREGERCERARAGAVVPFAPAERREGHALEDSRSLMLLAPWPGPGDTGYQKARARVP